MLINLFFSDQSQFVARKFVKSDPKHPEDTVASKNVTVYSNETLADGER